MTNTIINSVQLIGYAGKDVIISKLENGTKKATLILATNGFATNADDVRTKNTAWHKIVAWGRMAEDIALVAKKGSLLKITGHTKCITFVSAKGLTKKLTEVTLVDFIKLSKMA